MRSGKVELKRIDDKTSRQVSFSKRRSGLFKKAEELSVLCDVDVALFVVSASGKLYEFSSADILSKILERYSSLVDAEKACTRTIRTEEMMRNSGIPIYSNRTAQKMQLYGNARIHYRQHKCSKHTDVNSVWTLLELLLDSTLVRTRKRKTYLTTDILSTLQTAEEEMMKPKETEAITIDEEEEEEADDKNKLKKEQQTSSSTNSKAYCSLQEAMLSLA